jgi:hypothetical protein
MFWGPSLTSIMRLITSLNISDDDSSNLIVSVKDSP